jgi:N-acetylmuramic acid 6-phosphate etherase
MVEMRPTNAKLRERAVRIVAELAGTDIETARATLQEAGIIKTAVVMLKRRLTRAEAEAALAAAGGNVRRALQ